MVLLEIGGKTLLAQTTTPLQVNTELWFEVTKASQPPWLNIVPASRGMAGELLRLLAAESIFQGQSLENLQHLLAEKSLTPAVTNLLTQFQEQIAGLAVADEPAPEALIRMTSWLHKAAVPLPALPSASIDEFLTALRNLPPDSPLAGSKALASAERTAQMLTLMQGFNSSEGTSPPPFLIFPCFFTGDAGWGQWLFSLPEKKRPTNTSETCSIDMFLAMSNLGDVHVSLQLGAPVGKGILSLPTPEAVHHIDGLLADLTDRCKALGLPLDLSCRQATIPPLNTMKERLEQATGHKTLSLIDITA